MTRQTASDFLLAALVLASILAGFLSGAGLAMALATGAPQ